MSKEAMDELKREARLIKIWIRDVTARKQGRLRRIRAKLRAFSKESSGKVESPNCSQATHEQTVVPEIEE